MEVKKIIALILAWIQVVSGYPTLEKEFDAEEAAAKAENEISKSKSSKKMAASMDSASDSFPFGGAEERDFPTFGEDVTRDGFCPRLPTESLCDTNFCEKDQHCEKPAQKCCPVGCGGQMCVDAVPGIRREGECPDFWTVPVEKYPETPVNECEIDESCTSNPRHKCCGTEVSGTRKCVLPKA